MPYIYTSYQPPSYVGGELGGVVDVASDLLVRWGEGGGHVMAAKEREEGREGGERGDQGLEGERWQVVMYLLRIFLVLTCTNSTTSLF